MSVQLDLAENVIEDVAQAAQDNGWKRTQRFANLNNDGCIRLRWEKGSGNKAKALYFGINVHSLDIVDVRAIIANRQQAFAGNDKNAAINFLAG